MNTLNVNRAMLNRINTQHEIKHVNRRIDGVVEQMEGVDVVFRPMVIDGDTIVGSSINDIIGDVLRTNNFDWIYTDAINSAAIYEADVPSSNINNHLRPSGMWKGHISNNGTYIADTYSPLESFIRNADGSILFSLIQPQTSNLGTKNYGGNLQTAIMRLINITNLNQGGIPALMSALIPAIASSELFNTDSLYFIQNSDLIAQNFNNAHADSFTLHFE